MKKLILLSILLLIPLLRYFVADFKKSRHLLISFFVTSIPFQVAFPLYKLTTFSGCGTIGTVFPLLLPLVLVLLLLPIYSTKWTDLKFDNKIWPKLFLLIVLLSIFNPINEAKGATLVLFVFVFSHFLFFKIIGNILSESEIIKGTFDGLLILCSIQLALAICFPLLGIKAVTGLFYDGAEGWSIRNGRPGAVGTFTHPGNLALFSTIASSFFLGSYLSNYQRKTSLIFLIVNGITVLLTYSRTSYLTIIFDLTFVYFIFKNAKNNIFSLVNILKFLVPIVTVLGWVIFFSPFSDMFVNSNAEEMYMARMMHWLMALDIFQTSPILGAGLNAHLEYFAKHGLTMHSVDIKNAFIIANPIHNIHLIVLAESGIIGFVAWIAFLFYNIIEAKKGIANNKGNKIISLSIIGLVVAYSIYGITGWAPLSAGVLPFFLYFTFFASKFNKNHIKYN